MEARSQTAPQAHKNINATYRLSPLGKNSSNHTLFQHKTSLKGRSCWGVNIRMDDAEKLSLAVKFHDILYTLFRQSENELGW